MQIEHVCFTNVNTTRKEKIKQVSLSDENNVQQPRKIYGFFKEKARRKVTAFYYTFLFDNFLKFHGETCCTKLYVVYQFQEFVMI